ncbi:MAG: YidB family protein [Thiolinea sp.]
MDISSIMQMAAQTFQGKLDADGDGQIEISDLIPALQTLFTNGAGEFDFSSVIANLSGGGLGSIVQSWLGDGANAAVSGDQLTQLLGADKITSFADQLGLSTGQAVSGLQAAVPSMIDQASSGGSLLELAGGLLGGGNAAGNDLLNMAGKLFGR